MNIHRIIMGLAFGVFVVQSIVLVFFYKKAHKKIEPEQSDAYYVHFENEDFNRTFV
jgi:preprotein translocase subunit SecG